jgi:hypothetical protein
MKAMATGVGRHRPCKLTIGATFDFLRCWRASGAGSAEIGSALDDLAEAEGQGLDG